MSLSLPTMLAVLCLDVQEIQASACYTQLVFIHTFTFLESSVLLAMAFDSFVAICRPLHYTTILTSSVIGKVGLACLLKHGSCTTHTFAAETLSLLPCQCPLPCLLFAPGCSEVILFRCQDQQCLWTVCSYCHTGWFCLYTSFLRPDSEGCTGHCLSWGQLKALNTCVSHICVVLIFFCAQLLGYPMVHRFGKHLSPIVHIHMADIYLLLPPVLNPVVYSVRTKQIRLGILCKFGLRKRF